MLHPHESLKTSTTIITDSFELQQILPPENYLLNDNYIVALCVQGHDEDEW